jgi:hypothetical protein
MYHGAEPDWFYWLDGKLGHCNGSVYANSRRGARAKIREKHPGCKIAVVMSESEYHHDPREC